MSKQNPEDNNQEDYMEFAAELIAEVHHAINEEFNVSAFSWLKFTFGFFASQYIKKHFTEYAIVAEKLQVEEELKNAEATFKRLKRELKLVFRTSEKLKKQCDKQARVIEKEINELQAAISRLQKSKETLVADLRKEKIEDWYQWRLKDHRIKPSMIPGIGPTRISALDYVNIQTAADIIPQNENTGKNALGRVRGSYPNAEWEDLVNWREKLKQRLPSPIIKEPSQDEIQARRDKYDAAFSRLENSIEEKKMEIEALHNPSTEIGLKSTENSDNEMKIREQMQALEQQIPKIRSKLKLYEFITPDKLLQEVLKA